MESVKCVHCGLDCGSQPVFYNDKPFCCEGCKTVYKLLNDNKLFTYYQIDQSPGIKIENIEAGSRFAFLDKEEVRIKLLDFDEGNFSKVRFFIPSIHCSACIWLLENMHLLHSGIMHATVDFVEKKVTINFDNTQISLRKLAELLASIHYVPYISLSDLEKQAPVVTDKNLLVKIGIAGFAFGNIMLFSLADYVPGGELLERNFSRFFGYLSLILVIPVLFYSAAEYFVSSFKNLKIRQININLPIAVGIAALFIQSVYEILTASGSGYLDSLTGLVFFLLVGRWYQSHTWKALSFERDYKSVFPVAVTRIRNNLEEIVLLNELLPGDNILIRNNEIVPADSILNSERATIDYSFVTGESQPVIKRLGDTVFAGGKQKGASIMLQITKKTDNSKLTQIWNDSTPAETKSPLIQLVDKLGQRFSLAVLIISLIGLIYYLIFDKTLAIRVFTSILIVACPCAIALSIPFAFGTLMRLFGRVGFYLKNYQVIEKLAKVNAIVFDKTGTLTYPDKYAVSYQSNEPQNLNMDWIKSLVVHSTHPLSMAINNYLKENKTLEVVDFEEIIGQGMTGTVAGYKISIGSYNFVGSQKDMGANSAIESKVYVAIDGTISGAFSVVSRYREGAVQLIESLRNTFDLYLLSGDNDAERENLIALFGTANRVLFRQTPQDKLEFVKKLRQSGKYVMMVGDGLNDAGALQISNVAISIADDVFKFTPASDAILDAKNFGSLEYFLKLAKKCRQIVNLSFLISFLYNAIGLYFAFSGTLSPLIAAILMPASSVSAVLFVTLSTKFIGRDKL